MVNFMKIEQVQFTANVVYLGTIGKTSANSFIIKNNTWIIDTGVSNHTTRGSSILKLLKPSS